MNALVHILKDYSIGKFYASRDFYTFFMFYTSFMHFYAFLPIVFHFLFIMQTSSIHM